MIIRKAKIKDIPQLVLMAVDLLEYHENFDPYFSPANVSIHDIFQKFFKKCMFPFRRRLIIGVTDYLQ